MKDDTSREFHGGVCCVCVCVGGGGSSIYTTQGSKRGSRPGRPQLMAMSVVSILPKGPRQEYQAFGIAI